MRYASPSIEKAIEQLSRLPGIGRKSAQRIVFHLLRIDEGDVRELAQSLLELKQKVRHCSVCFNLSEEDPCRICSDPQRDRSVVCVVEQANDVLALERTGQYRGLYHVLGGALSPLDGIGPDNLRIAELVRRLEKGEIRRGSLSLYRGYRAPPGGEASYFAPGSLERIDDVEGALRPVMDGILYLEFRFWN